MGTGRKMIRYFIRKASDILEMNLIFMRHLKLRILCLFKKDFYPTFREAQYMQYIEQWELPTDKKIGEFSKGMKVKLMFAGVLARDTRVLLLDEATSGLDPITRDEVLVILQKYIEDGERDVLFSTHIYWKIWRRLQIMYFLSRRAGKCSVIIKTRLWKLTAW